MGVEDPLHVDSDLDVFVVTGDLQNTMDIGDVHISDDLWGRRYKSAATRGNHQAATRSKEWPIEGWRRRRSHDEREELQEKRMKRMKRMKKLKKLKKRFVELVEKIFFSLLEYHEILASRLTV